MAQVGDRVCITGENVCGAVKAASEGGREEGVYFVDDKGNGWCVPSQYITVVKVRETILPAEGGTLHLGQGFDLNPQQRECLRKIKFEPVQGNTEPLGSFEFPVEGLERCLGIKITP